MSETTPPAGIRGAVDLSSVGVPVPAGASQAPSTAPAGSDRAPAGALPVPAGLVVEVDAANLQQALSRTVQVPGVLVLWSSAHPQTRELVDTVIRVAASLQGQPVPLFPGVQPESEVRVVIDQLLQAAIQNGVTGRVELEQPVGPVEEEVPPLHQAAYDAIEVGDMEAAAAAFAQALVENPKDYEAEVGLAQVKLMQRTQGVDLAAARAAAAADPTDVDAATLVADLDIVGGHVEDAFARLLDIVRSDEEARDRARAHLLDLFAVVGSHDERVRKGRTALMSALF